MPRPRFDPSRAIPNRELFCVNLRDALRCRSCGRTPARRETYHRGFEYHHLQHRADGGPDSAENVVLLCRRCHDRHHRGRDDEIALPTTAGRVPGEFACRQCGAGNDPRAVEMNCGWYRCGTCGERVHLFDHFALSER